MQSINMDKQEIRQLTGDRFYKRGRDYYTKGKVYGLSYNPATNAWRGLVKGAKVYTIRIYLFDDKELETSCTCPAYATHFTCKHIAAVLLALTEEENSGRKKFAVDHRASPTTPTESDLYTKQLLYTFRELNTELEQTPEKLETEVILAIEDANQKAKHALTIEVKIGDKRPYVIKDIRSFLVAFQTGDSYKINQSFTYTSREYYFQQEDLILMELLSDCYDQEKMYGNTYLHKMEHPRSLYVPPNLSEKLLKTVENRSLSFKAKDGSVYPAIELEEQMPELDFTVDYLKQDVYTLEMTDLSKYTFLENYRYLVKDNVFYSITFQEKQFLEKLFRVHVFQQNEKHRIAPKEMSTFVKNVLPSFEKVGNVTLTDSMQTQLNTEPLRIKLYIDEEDDAVKSTVTFSYGDTVISPFSRDDSGDKITKRDRFLEQEFIYKLLGYGFIEMKNGYFLFNPESIYDFFHKGIDQLRNLAQVYISDQVKRMIGSQQAVKLESRVQFDQSRGMLDIQFDMGGISDEDVSRVLTALIEKKKYYRIPNGELIALDDDSFESFFQLAEQVNLSKKDISDGQITLNAAQSFQVEEALNPKHTKYNDAFQTLFHELKHPELLDFSLPNGLNAEMRDYQIVGFQWMKSLSHYHLGGILADDMGLGKTLQTISFLLSEIQAKDESYQALVVAPASLLYNWQKEIEKFAPSITSTVIIGSKKQRRERMVSAKESNILITSYPTLRKDLDLYEENNFDCLILDEAQAIKNHLTLTAKAVRSLQARQRFALSGTPIENALDELWSIFYTVSPGLFGSKKTFAALDPTYIAKITRPFILRRIKKDVLHELPDKIETVMYSELTKDQKEVYVAYLNRMREQLDSTVANKGFGRGKLEILAGITRLRQVCCHPSLFLENYQGECGKLDQLMELADELVQNKKRTLIFSQFSSMLTLIRKSLEAAGHPTFYLDGSTPSEKRMEMVDAFNSGEKGFFLISLKAGGTGLNLTGADTVLLYDLWWNPAVEEQAAGRAHRIGQKKVVQVIRLITEGTIEEKIYQLQHQKRELVDKIIQPGETLLSKLSEDEIRELLQIPS
ncbi:DEAD/DEAH box helicase [Saliterribacillus persicus]|uniref:SNF2 family DNA or RNA helicase n=1 Tax=Saliterribacillus persicus TaxID=930114 RepID=A0A368XM17_9BACI|nr:DEAD/DEAH box helicase [Saliterribacillus persicus]RCW67074.1 SNF2 family DNA or RNA helicase [Saliterribacillus persicus]